MTGRLVKEFEAVESAEVSNQGASETAKALAHPLRVRILICLEKSPAGPLELASELEQNIGLISYHLRTLEHYGLIEVERTEPRRGAVLHIYRRTPRSLAIFGRRQ